MQPIFWGCTSQYEVVSFVKNGDQLTLALKNVTFHLNLIEPGGPNYRITGTITHVTSDDAFQVTGTAIVYDDEISLNLEFTAPDESEQRIKMWIESLPIGDDEDSAVDDEETVYPEMLMNTDREVVETLVDKEFIYLILIDNSRVRIDRSTLLLEIQELQPSMVSDDVEYATYHKYSGVGVELEGDELSIWDISITPEDDAIETVVALSRALRIEDIEVDSDELIDEHGIAITEDDAVEILYGSFSMMEERDYNLFVDLISEVYPNAAATALKQLSPEY